MSNRFVITCLFCIETPPGKSNDSASVPKTTKGNAYLIAVVLALLAVVILAILTLLWFFFVHKPRSQGN